MVTWEFLFWIRTMSVLIHSPIFTCETLATEKRNHLFVEKILQNLIYFYYNMAYAQNFF